MLLAPEKFGVKTKDIETKIVQIASDIKELDANDI